ncbi:unnamed protein product [Scytosiphon promiscuus]
MNAREGACSGPRGDEEDAGTHQLPSRWVAAALAGQGSTVTNKPSADSTIVEHSSSSAKKWAGMRLVDTVMFDSSGEVDSWVFTAKAGHITSKKRAQARGKIAERFERFALANPRNSEQYVALLAGKDQSEERIALTKMALREMLSASSQELSQELSGATLQCYLRPKNGSNSFLQGCYHHRESDLPFYSLDRVSPLYRLPRSAGEFPAPAKAGKQSSTSPLVGDDPESKRLRSEAETALASLVAFLELELVSEGKEGRAPSVRTCKADFIIDDNGELWLTSVPSVAVPGSLVELQVATPQPYSSASHDRSTPEEEREGEDATGSHANEVLHSGSLDQMPPLLGCATTTPQVAAPLDGSDRTPLGSARQQLPSASSGASVSVPHITPGDSSQQLQDEEDPGTGGELPTISSKMLGVRNAPADSNTRIAENRKKGNDVPFIEKREGVYVANVHASALRGLCCWRESGGGSRGRDSPRWQLVDCHLKGNHAGEEGARAGADPRSVEAAIGGGSSPESFDELSKARFKMTARSVLLAMAASTFLRSDEPFHIAADGGGDGDFDGGVCSEGSFSQRWKECDQQAQLSLARANPQAYYDEVIVCGNCMEICRKLDSIRMAGFPEPPDRSIAGCAGSATTIAAATALSDGDANNLSSRHLPRPRSEPLPDCISTVPSLSGQEQRPTTASAAKHDGTAGRGAVTVSPLTDALPTTKNAEVFCSVKTAAGVDEESADSSSSLAALDTAKSNGVTMGDGAVVEGSTTLSARGIASGGDVERNAASKPGPDDTARKQEHEIPAVVAVAKAVRHDDAKTISMLSQKEKAAMDRISGVYGDGPRTGGVRVTQRNKHTSGKKKKNGKARVGELPNVATVARFAIERERLAREMGVDELGGPATLGVVNVGVASVDGRSRASRRFNGEGGGPGSTLARNHQQGRGKERGRIPDDGSGSDDDGAPASSQAPEAVAQRKSAGEMLLEKLESVAEARSIESAGGSCCGGHFKGGSVSHGDWCAEEQPSTVESIHGERRAGTAGRTAQPREGAAWGRSPSPFMGELSTTESAFLERSRRLDGRGGGVDGDLGGSGGKGSLFGGHFEAGFRDESGGADIDGDGSVRGGHAATIGALRDRLTTLEGENTALRARARRAEEERSTEAARGDKASKKLAQARMEFSRAMSEKDEDYHRRELELQERHSRELASKSQTAAEEMMKAATGPDGEELDQHGGGGRGIATPGAKEKKSSKSLIARLDQVLKDMAEQQRRFAQARRTLLAEKTMEVAAAEAKGRHELQQTRTLAAAMEDKASSLQEQVSEAAKQISTLKAREDEQRKRRRIAEEEAEKIRKDIGVLRQSVRASQSMDLKDESGGRHDVQSTLATVTATSEARIRTLNNKVEFLKAQLASEQTLKAEVEAALALSRKSLFAAKDESRKQAAASDKAREAAVEEAVTRVNRQVEESMSETYRVQSKVQALQDQLSDALGDMSMARRREEALKAELALVGAKLEDRGTELAKAQSRADDLAGARAADTESSADRAAREAVVRRLDNERQYLKSQLQSEITCKDELREALTTATRQLGDVKADWVEEQTSRTDKFQRELQVKTEAMNDLNCEKVAMEAELVAATRQVGLLKEGYSKARDNLRAEQSALETARTANRRLREEVTACNEELAAIKAQQGEDARRHSQSLVAARTALDEADESKRQQGAEQQIQLREQLLKTGEVQRQLMRLQSEVAGRERVATRRLAAERLGQGIARWCINRKASAFYNITCGVSMLAAESDVRERTRRALREAGEGARRAQEEAVEEARRVAAGKAEEDLAEAERYFMEERDRLLEEVEASAAVAATQAQTIDELKTLEAAVRQELEKARQEQTALSNMNFSKEKATKYRENLEGAAQEARTREEQRVEAAISSTKEACEEASATAKEQSDEKWRVVLREHLQKAEEAAMAVAAAASRDHDALLEETQQAFRTERQRLREETEQLVSSAAGAERERGLKLSAEAKAAGAAEATAAHALASELKVKSAAEEAAARAEESATALREKAEAARAAGAVVKEELRLERNARAEELAKLKKELVQARERAVKLEGGKWKRASEEAEARAATEQAAAYERGTADRGRQAEVEAYQLQDAAQKALEEVKQGARATIEEMIARNAEELESERKRVSDEEAVAHRAALEAAREELSQQHIKAVASARAAATAEARARAERDRASAVEAAKERERLVTEKVQDELRSARTEWAAERRRLKEQTTVLEEEKQKAKDDLLRAMANSSQATQRARARWEEGQKSAMEKAAAEAVEEREKALEDARRAFSREKKRAVMETQDAFAAQAEAMADRLRKEASASLQKAESMFAEAQQEKGRLTADLEGCRRELEECGSSLLHSEADLKEQSVSHSIHTWRMAVATLTIRVNNEKAAKHIRDEAAEREAEAESMFEAQKEALSAVVEELLQLAFDSRRRFAAMQETLVNHKREVLIDHKVQSSSLHKELDSLARERDQLEEQRLLLQREFRELEGQAKDAEKEAHAHSRQSAIGPDGMIIPARARKKRRLDEELEGLLEAMEAKRKALVALDTKLNNLAESRSVKDEEMKGLERTLVQVLVEQQKKLLSLLSEAGKQAAQVQEIDERTRFARDEAKRLQAQARNRRQERGDGVGG